MWNRVVTIEIGGVARRTSRIYTTDEAAAYLLNSWPGLRGREYRDAIIGCTKALKGQIPDAEARLFFIAAAKASQLPHHVSHDITEHDAFIADLTEACRESLLSARLGG